MLLITLLSAFAGCTTLGPHSGSVASRSLRLSSGLQKAYTVSPSKAQRLSPMIIQSADQYQVPPLLVAALIKQESNYNSAAHSTTGAVGLTQIIPSYWQEKCVGDLHSEATNIQCSAYILNHYHELSGSWFKATAYYNVGPVGYKSSFWTRHKAKKYARQVRRYENDLKATL
ncbi:lytic transglycosylase domain-containing protein [Acinetobacter sp. ANC 4640]